MDDEQQQPQQPMTDERLAQIAAYWDGIYHLYYVPGIQEPPDTIHDAVCHVDDLLGEIRRLRAEIATMRSIVAAVAEHIGSGVSEHFRQCAFCANGAVESRIIVHADDCEVTRARTFLAQYPAE